MSILILAVFAIPEKEVTITFKIDNVRQTRTVRCGSTQVENDKFNILLTRLKENAPPEQILAAMDTIYNINTNSKEFTISPDGLICYVNGDPLPKGIGDRILDFSRSGLDFAPLVKFWKNCVANPDPIAKSDLFQFLEQNGHPITDDGCFIAYRAVRGDYMDKYTGTIFNGIGSVVTKKREECDANRDVTCSHGLHAAAYEYAKNTYGAFGYGSTDHLMEVKIDPKDVVAIPRDYHAQKMRVCKYIVVAENTQGKLDSIQYEKSAHIPEVNIEDIGVDDESGAVANVGAVPEFSNGKFIGHDGWKAQGRSANGRFMPKNKV